MKKWFVISVLTFIVFLVEFFLFNLFGNFFHPNLLILLLIFLHVRLGLEYSLVVAFLGGMLKDSFSTGILGGHILVFVICAFLISFLKPLIYQKGYNFSRILMAFVMSLISVVLIYWFNMMGGVISAPQSIIYLLLSEVAATTVLSMFTFRRLKRCVLKFSA